VLVGNKSVDYLFNNSLNYLSVQNRSHEESSMNSYFPTFFLPTATPLQLTNTLAIDIFLFYRYITNMQQSLN